MSRDEVTVSPTSRPKSAASEVDHRFARFAGIEPPSPYERAVVLWAAVGDDRAEVVLALDRSLRRLDHDGDEERAPCDSLDAVDRFDRWGFPPGDVSCANTSEP